MMIDVKEINKEFKLAMKHFKMAMDLAKVNFIVGQYVVNSATEKKARKPRAQKTKEDPKNLPDMDKSGYMKKRAKMEEGDKVIVA